MRRRAAGAALAVLATALAWPAVSAGAALQPLGLGVEGGEQSWRPSRSFSLSWTNPPRDGEPPVAAVRYRLLDPTGQQPLLEKRIGWAASTIQVLTVPVFPGAYLAEVRLEDAGGAIGPPATARLRFDDVKPGPVEPPAPDGWLGRGSFPLELRLGRPAGPEPLSGIRGYAVSVDVDPGAAPCAGPSACSETETDLRGGPEEDLLTLGLLPEGESFLHAAAVSGSGLRSATIGTAALRVDTTAPLTRLSGAPAGWSRGPVRLTARATDAASGMVEAGAGGPSTAIRIDDGAPVVARGDSVSATVIGSGVHTVAHYARDAAGNVADGGSVNGVPNREPGAAVVRIDREPPRIAFSRAQDPADPELIVARAGDALSGLDRGRGRIAVRAAGSAARFEPLPTAVGAGALRARWPSESYPPGEYEFRATAYDLAGNAASTSARANGAPMRLRAPLKVATALLVGFGGRVLHWHRCRRTAVGRRCRQATARRFDERPARRAIPHGRRALLSGRLIAGRRAPLAGMPVRVIERFENGAGRRARESTVRTGPGGEFRLRLAPGPSREIVALAPPTPTLQAARGRALRLAVRGRVLLRVSSRRASVGGRPVVFHGRVASPAALPADGKAVELQFRLPGLPWSEFRTVRSDRRGRFRLAYRFSDDDSRGARFEFRAYAPAQAGWPFEPAGSRPVIVRGV